jgi:hypothetical protein
MGQANVILRRCTLARLVLSSRLTISILSLGLFMTSSSGCVLPVGPRFEDPPATENIPPYIKSTTPPAGQIVTAVNRTQMFSVSYLDLNADHLYVRWLGDGNTHRLQDDRDVPAPLNGQTSDYPDQPITVDCALSSLALTNQHTITVLISDQPFWNPSDPDAPTDANVLLTHNKANSVMAQANWVLNLPCP